MPTRMTAAVRIVEIKPINSLFIAFFIFIPLGGDGFHRYCNYKFMIIAGTTPTNVFVARYSVVWSNGGREVTQVT